MRSVLKQTKLILRVFGSGKKTQLSLNDFLVGVGQLKFRGTSVLLRSPNGSVVQNLKRIQTKDETGKSNFFGKLMILDDETKNKSDFLNHNYDVEYNLLNIHRA